MEKKIRPMTILGFPVVFVESESKKSKIVFGDLSHYIIWELKEKREPKQLELFDAESIGKRR